MVQQQPVAVAVDQVLMILVIMLLKAVLVEVLLADTGAVLTQTASMEQQILAAVEVVHLVVMVVQVAQAALVS
jgi:hypothetical protein|tara:strand:- start:62 stop:280 length:219 start_codon:yes stop_codon:yes gene_type:complete